MAEPARRGPPPIPKEEGPPPTPQERAKAQRTVLEFMRPALDEVAELALAAKKTRDDFHSRRNRLLEVTKLLASFHKKNPREFQAAMGYLKKGNEAWMALDDAVMKNATEIFQSFNKLYAELNTFLEDRAPAKKLSPEERMPPETPRKTLEMLLVKEEGMDPEQAKETVRHMSDEQISKIIPAGELFPPRIVQFRGKMYRRASVGTLLKRTW